MTYSFFLFLNCYRFWNAVKIKGLIGLNLSLRLRLLNCLNSPISVAFLATRLSIKKVKKNEEEEKEEDAEDEEDEEDEDEDENKEDRREDVKDNFSYIIFNQACFKVNQKSCFLITMPNSSCFNVILE